MTSTAHPDRGSARPVGVKSPMPSPRSSGKPGPRQSGRQSGHQSGRQPGSRKPGPNRSTSGKPARRGSALKEINPPTARSLAYARLAADAADFPDLVPADLDTGPLDPRDAALAHAIHDTVIRRWWTLQSVVAPFMNKPFLEFEPGVRAALLAGAAQLLFFDRVPAHAAISETVEWSKRAIRPGAGGLVNAVLRRVSELAGDERTYRDTFTWQRDEVPLADGRALVLASEILPEDRLARTAAAVSIAVPLLESWADAHGVDAARDLALHTLAVPPVTMNVRHAESPVPNTEPHGDSANQQPGFAVYTGPMPALGDLLTSRDDIWVQDAASGEAVASIADLDFEKPANEPPVIVDLCAGKGTKTRQLARTFPHAEIVATDTDAPRLAVLGRVFADHDRVRVLDFPDVLDDCLGRADLVLLDVPCSNTGVLARRPEAKYRPMTKQRDRLTDTQRQIVADAIRLLAPHGRILYSTCSLQREENHEIARWAKTWHGFEIERERMTLPAGLPGDPPTRYHDGSYSVLLSR
jgi:16S rRNA (cytosine967-C5)-methyltransferase